MEALRRPVDELEMIVDKDIWPMRLMGICYLMYKTAAGIIINNTGKGVPDTDSEHLLCYNNKSGVASATDWNPYGMI